MSSQVHAFVVPTRRIMLPGHLAGFLSSTGYKNIVAFIQAVNGAVKGKTLAESPSLNEVFECLGVGFVCFPSSFGLDVCSVCLALLYLLQVTIMSSIA